VTNNDFFSVKKPWSKIKDDLLGYYLALYFPKILATHKPVCYIDCFAGKGKFDDGEDGSPLIALKIAAECLENANNNQTNINHVFIENKYAKELYHNTFNFRCDIIKGNYEDNIENVLRTKVGYNIFLYVDPFGIKSLSFRKFVMLNKYHFNSIELLLNLNSFGFLREGCRVLRCKDIDVDFDEYQERENEASEAQPNNILNMNNVANGDYWQQIIRDYSLGKLDVHDAEEKFTKEYCMQLRQVFDYVIDIPIKPHIAKIPKYRMVFCTNHKHGLIEMATNMNKRWKQMQIESAYGQTCLFQYDVDAKANFVDKNVESVIIDIIKNSSTGYKYDDLICEILKMFGILYSTSEINECVKQMEKDKKVIILRNPSKTLTGKLATWIDFKRDMRVKLNNVQN